MSSSARPELGSDRLKISAVTEAWIEAVEDGDANTLASLVTDDFVAVHRDGRCVTGKGELQADFHHAFGLFDAQPKVLSSELIVKDKWAIEVLEVETTRSPIGMDVSIPELYEFVVVFARQADYSWKVARLVELRA